MKRILFFAAAMAALVSCQKNVTVTPENPSEAEKVKINLAVGVWTKVTDTSFEPEDEVGIYVVNYVDGAEGKLKTSGNHYDNVKHTYGTSSWTPAEDMYWLDRSTKADFYCYYPYGTPGNVAEYPFSVKADQSAAENYKSSDFAWGKAAGIVPTSSTVQIATNHIMSNMAIYVEPGDGFTAETFAAADVAVSVRNVKTGAVIDLSNGAVTASGAETTVTPYKDGTCYRAIIVPQTVAEGSALVVVTVNGTEYSLKKGFTFVSGEQHKFVFKVNKTGSGVNVGIGDWKTDGEDNGGSAE